MTALLVEQSRALLGLRLKIWWRRFVRERRWGRAAASIAAALVGAGFSASVCALLLESARQLRLRPDQLRQLGGIAGTFTAWLSGLLLARLWFGLVAVLQSGSLLDPRRFRLFPVPAALVSGLNFAAVLLDPVWLLLYPPLAVLPIALGRLPGAPHRWAMAVAEVLAVLATVGLLQLASALSALVESRPILRRGFAIALLLAGIAGFQLSVGTPRATPVFSPQRWALAPWLPPAWAARLAQALSRGDWQGGVRPALLLLGLAAATAIAAHRLSLRELLRPPNPVQAPASAGRSRGWRLPLLPERFSALLEKEARTVFRIGWIQLVVVPVAYLLLVRAVLPGPQPLLVAAVYAHLGVLEIATNAFGRDLSAARGYFLWPVGIRSVLAAKNAVAYGFSLAIFLVLAAATGAWSHLTRPQFLVGLLAHAATFPLVATFGNVASAVFPVPVRAALVKRVRGAGPIGARLLALLLLAGGAWAPFVVARALGLRLSAVYAGELFAMAAAYPALLGACALLVDRRREAMLAALAADE